MIWEREREHVSSAAVPTPPQGGWEGVEGGKEKRSEKRIAKRPMK